MISKRPKQSEGSCVCGGNTEILCRLKKKIHVLFLANTVFTMF